MTGTYVPRPEWLVLDWHHACAAADGLAMQRCSSCGIWRHPPRRFCGACHGAGAAFEPVAGTGIHDATPSPSP